MAEKKFQRHLYYLRFGSSNPYGAIHVVMTRTFDHTDQWIAFDPFTFLVYTDKHFNEIHQVIGIDMIKTVDDFMIMEVGYASAMSTFTDRNDIIGFLRSIKRNVARPALLPSQATIDAILDKVGLMGRSGLSRRELEILKSLGSDQGG